MEKNELDTTLDSAVEDALDGQVPEETVDAEIANDESEQDEDPAIDAEEEPTK